MTGNPPGERLTRMLARAGVASRRKVEGLIRSGRVSLNGVTVRSPAARVRPARDQVAVDGQPVTLERAERVVVALNKPSGYVTTLSDPEGRPTVADLLGKAPAGLHPVGRLDFDSRGLLLLTNDGDLTLELTHPRHHVPKTYRVKVEGRPAEPVLADLRAGIPLADGLTAPAEIAVRNQDGENTWLEIILKEGRNRQIRRMMATVGHPVLDLVRMSVGPVGLHELEPGHYRVLDQEETTVLIKSAGGDE